jgi:hypothetical protein
MLVTAYQMLKYRRHYQELGGDFLDQINRDQVRKRLVQRLAKLGFEVTLKSKAESAGNGKRTTSMASTTVG